MNNIATIPDTPNPLTGILLLCLIFLASCTCAARDNVKKDPIDRAMDDSIGVMTYDEAIEKLGEPTSVTQGAGSLSAVWIDEVEISERPDIVYIIKPDYKTEVLTLEFDNNTKKLLRWKHEKLK